MNFIIFMPDELRAESVGCYGHPLVKTPNIDRLAEEGVRFDCTYVQHTVCSPSRCSMMTGWYPHVAGHRTLWHMLRPHEPNLLKYLKEAGYDVYWYGKNDLLAIDSFPDSVTEFGGGGGSLVWGGNPFPTEDPRHYSFLYEPWEGPVENQMDAACVLRGIDVLKQRKPGDKPFLLYLPLVYPHCPYTVCQPWYDMYDPDDLPQLRPSGLEGKPDYHDMIRHTRRLDQCDEGLFRKINAVYLGMTSFIDHTLGWMLDALDETGLADDTTVLFFADHGDWAGDYGLVEKWTSALDDCLTRVPFVIRAPGGKTGHIVREPVELFDLMATVLELAGVEGRHTHFSQSLVSQIQGAPGDESRAAYADGGYDTHEGHCFEGRGLKPGSAKGIYYPKMKLQQTNPETICRATMIRTATHKLVVRPDGVDELYDMVNDPRELDNLAGRPDNGRLQRELERRMLEWFVHTADVVPFDEDPRGLPAG